MIKENKQEKEYNKWSSNCNGNYRNKIKIKEIKKQKKEGYINIQTNNQEYRVKRQALMHQSRKKGTPILKMPFQRDTNII